MRRKIFFAIFCIVSTALFAQRGRDGSPIISTTLSVNEYTSLTANAPAGSNIITVASSTLNSHGRFLSALGAGDLIMIIQMQGAGLKGSINPIAPDSGLPKDSSWGTILNYYDCGNYEFAEVDSVPTGTTIKLDCPLQYSYIDTGRVQIVRVQRYNSLTINNGGKITCDPWDSAIGGIIAIEVENNTVINAGGSINADSAGFRPGKYNGQDSVGWGIGDFASRFQSYGKEKGEGIGGYEWNYLKYGGKEGMGAPGNGGGGGTAQNGGGGGGANGGVVANYINGFGNPDISTLNNRTAWNLEYTWMSTFTSSGGGRGGYSFSGNNVSPQTDGPGNGAWGGDDRRSVGGRGGRPLDYSTGKIFMGGGGGAGDQNDNYGGQGGAGGGLIYIMSYGTVSGTGQIVSNGENGYNTLHPSPGVGHASGIDGAGGAGAGGTIIVNSVGNISGITLNANGGTGGNQIMVWDLSTDKEAEGPGGGGGGGYIATSNGGLTETVTGGANGTTNATPMAANFPPNGATIGGVGTSNATITNFHLAAINNDTICSGNTATLNETILGSPPGGITIEWYTADSGNVTVGSGPSYTTPILFTTKTYYVGTCPGTYRIPVTVVVKGAGAVTVSNDTGICKGASEQLKASGGTAYAWLPVSGLSNPAIANPVATPTTTTTYTVSVTTTCGVVKDSVKVTVIPLPTIILGTTGNPICAGQSTTISASGGGTYLWNTGATTSSILITPPSNVTDSVMVTNTGCKKDTFMLITVNPLPIVGISATNTTVCAGSSTTITATGGGTYLWSDASSSTTSSISVTPLSNATYTVIVTKNGCPKDTMITITVTPLPTIIITRGDTSICTGGTATLSVTGGGSYVWSDASSSTTSSISVTPASNTTYTVTVTKNGCSNTALDSVRVSSTLTVNITGPKIICSGETVTLKTSGGGTYIWSPGGATTDSIRVSPTKATNYSVTVTNGCMGTATTSISVYNPTLFACCDTIIQSGNSTNLNASGSGITHYQWTPNTGLKCDTCPTITVSPTVTTSYTVTGIDSLGCPVDRVILVSVEEPCFTDTIPNVFTPNYAGSNPVKKNNIFYINTSNLNSWSVIIFDRWGKEVFNTTSLNQYWDGNTESGGQAPAGVYYYLINTTCNGNTTKRQGYLQLIR